MSPPFSAAKPALIHKHKASTLPVGMTVEIGLPFENIPRGCSLGVAEEGA